MAALRDVASGFAHYLAGELSFDQKTTDTIRYGMEILLGAIVQGVIIIGASYLLGIMPYVVVALGTLSILRLLSGGAHFSTFGRCTVFSTSMAMSVGYLAIAVTPYMDKKAVALSVALTAFIALYLASRWAPVDSPSKPTTREDKRRAYKRLSSLYVVFWAIIVTLIVFVYGGRPPILSLILASTGGLIAQLFSLHPSGRRFVGAVDDVLSKCSIRR
ncbi:MAG TPA: accessory gene regulator B family protein [Anaerolineae bacterium]|jgi:accessory gene regulator B|nr:accessory gene regulator B family protein [Anaerolineae bacterium]